MAKKGYWKVVDLHKLNVVAGILVAKFSTITDLVKVSKGKEIKAEELYGHVRKAFEIAFDECKKQGSAR